MVEFDLERGEQRRNESRRRLNTREIPLTRLLGFGMLLVALAISGPSTGLGLYAAVVVGYALGSWALLAWLYRPEARLDLGLVFLMLDVPLFCLALPQTGGAASWFALALLLRVADQIPAGTRRVALFCHWTVLCYVGVLVLSSPLGEVLWRAALLYLAGLYLVLASGSAERARASHADTLRYARELLASQRPLVDYIGLLSTETDTVLRSLKTLRDQHQLDQQLTGQACSTSQEISREASRLAHEVARVAVSGEDAAGLAESGRALLAETRQRLQSLVRAYGSLSDRLRRLEEIAGQITTVTRTMSTVAYQSNLLSLNAAIQASRAGETGRAFSVVANEIRRLATQAAESTVEIGALVGRIQASAGESLASMKVVGGEVSASERSLEEMVAQLTGVLDRVEGMSSKFEEMHRGIKTQARRANEIRSSLEDVAQNGRETSGSLEGVHQLLLRILDLAPKK